MRTLFFVINSGFVSKNVLRTDVLRLVEAEKDLRIVIIVPNDRVKEYRALFESDTVCIEGVLGDATTFMERLWIKFMNNAVETDTLRIQRGGGPLSPRASYAKRCYSWFARLVFNNAFGRILLRTIDMYFGSGRDVCQLFGKHEPVLVFVANIFSSLDMRILREARRRGISTVGMVKSWDNITSKGLIRQLPNWMIVHTHIMKEELVKYADMPATHIFVSGVPQYDMYFRPETLSREAFCRKFNLDPSRRIVLLLEPGLKLAPHGHDIWDMLERSAERGEFPADVQILVSIHPAYRAREDLMPRFKHLHFVRLGYRLIEDNYKTWEFSEEAASDLMHAVRWSDVVITTFSTMNIEAAIFDKPIINIAFDGYQKLPYNRSVAQYRDYAHLQPIVSSGGVRIVTDETELLEEIARSLKDPAWGREGRARIVDVECVFSDGRSSERIARFILDCVKISDSAGRHKS